MADQETTATSNPGREESSVSESSGGSSRSSGSTDLARGASSSEPLETERGQTNIADGVVTKVAGLAAGEVPGVYELGGSTARAMGAMTQRVGIGDTRTQGVSVEVGEREAAVDLTIVVEYGESIPQVAEQVRQQIIKRVEGITGLTVVEVNINVDDLHFPGDEEPEETRVS